MARHMGGWVKLHRKAALGDINSNFTRGGLFTALIAMANIQNSKIDWKGSPRDLERGQIATSYHELAELGGVDRKTVTKHVQYLKQRGTINIEKSKQGILITFPKYEEYAGVDAEWSPKGPHGMDDGMDRSMDNGVPHNEERKNKRKKERESQLAAKPLAPLIKIWNEHCGDLAKVHKSNKSRNRKIELRWEENAPEEWTAIVQRIAKSDFCTGKNDRGWKATFDWLLQTETHLKVAEGKYDNGDGSPSGEISFVEYMARKRESGGAQ